MKQDRTHKLDRRFLIFLSFVFLFSFLKAQEISSEIEKKIQLLEQNIGGKSLQEVMESNKVNGLSIAVVHDFKVDWAKGYGMADVDENRPVTTETAFQAASISKSLNGVAILNLVQENKLDLNRNVNDYLNSWKLPEGSEINASQLLSHTSGLSVHGFPGYAKGEKIPSHYEILEGRSPSKTEAIQVISEPGTKYQYSGGGTLISQVLLSDISGEGYEKYLDEKVLQPLGMTNSFYSAPTSLSNFVATAYNDGKEVEGKYHVYPEMAAAGLWTTPSDLAKYIIDTQLSYNGLSEKVLNQRSTQTRLTPVKGNSALGVYISDKGNETYFYHSGINEGFTSYYYAGLNDGNGVVIMMNSNYNSLPEQIMKRIAQIYDWEGFVKEEAQF